MDLREWLVGEFDDTAMRLQGQVLDLVPEDRRRERPGGGNSVLWACYHSARHADLALSVLTGRPIVLAAADNRDGGGLEEGEQPWSAELDSRAVDSYLAEVVSAGRRFLTDLDDNQLDRVADTDACLREAGISAAAFPWLFNMWRGQPAAFLLRWPIIGHLGNHIGEMIATRNRMGLSPF